MKKRKSPLNSKRRRKRLYQKSNMNLKYRSSSLSKIMKRLIRMSLLSSRLRRMLKKLLKKLNLRKLMTTHSSLKIQQLMSKSFPLK
jgi:hypothetical protein